MLTGDQSIELGHALLRLHRIGNEPDRPTIIFLHDSLGCIKLWREFPDRLCKMAGCNGLLYDRQGYGESSAVTEVRSKDYLEKEADTLCQLIAALELKHVVLFGHSDGGSISLIAAAKHPEQIKAVITEGAHVFVETITLDGIRAAKEQYTTTNLRQRLKRYHGDKTDMVFSIWADTWLSPAFHDFNMEHFLPRIKCPVMVLQGVDDEFGTEAQVDAIVNQVTGTSFKCMIDGAGHNPHKEAQESTLKETASFIAEHAQS